MHIRFKRRIRLRTLAIAWAVLMVILIWGLIDSLSGAITQPLIRNSELRWSSYHAYKLLIDDRQVTTGDVRSLIKACRSNEKWAYKTAKKLKLSKLTPKKRVRKIVRYIARLYSYDINVKYVEQARKVHRANCAAYADTEYILCKAAGIPVRYIIGYDHGECHAWCRVRISGVWFWSDPTRSDGLSGYALSRKLWSGYGSIIDEW